MRSALIGCALLLATVPAAAFPLKLDADGIPLPPGAIARLGTTLNRTSASWRDAIVFAPDGSRVAFASNSTVTVHDLATGRVAYRLDDPKKLRPVKQVHGEIHTLKVAFSPDAKHLLTSDATATIQVWDAATGKWERAVTLPKETPGKFDVQPEVIDLVSCPAANKFLARAGGGHAFFLDPADWSWKYLSQISDDITGVSPDGQRAVTHYNVEALYQECTVIETANGKSVATVDVPDGAWYAALSPDNTLVASGGIQIALKNLGTDKYVKLAGGEKPFRGIIRTLAFSPNSKTLFAAADDHPAVARWNTATGERLADIPAGVGEVRGFAITADGKQLITVSSDGVIRRFELPSGKEIAGADGFASVSAVSITADGKLAAVADRAGMIRTWSAPFTGQPRTLRKTGPAVTELAFSLDGKTLYVAQADFTLGIWDVATGKETILLPALVKPNQNSYQPPLRFAVSPDGKRVIGSVWHRAIWAWDTATGKILWERRAEPREQGDGVTEAKPVFSHDGKMLYIGLLRGQVGRYDPETGKEIGPRIKFPEFGRFRWDARRLVLSTDSRSLLVEINYNDAHLYLIDLTTDRMVWRHDFLPKSGIVGAAFTPDGRTVLLTHWDGQSRTLDAATGRPVERFRVLPTNAGNFTLSADGRLAISTAPAATALVWELKP